MAAVLTDINIAPQRRFVKQTGRLFDGQAVLVQKEEGLREEHGFSRQIARGPRRGAARRFRRNARDREGSWQGRQALTEGL